MLNVNPEKFLRMFEYMCNKHRGEMLSAYLDWEVIKMTHPNWPDQVFDQALPLFVIDFKP